MPPSRPGRDGCPFLLRHHRRRRTTPSAWCHRTVTTSGADRPTTKHNGAGTQTSVAFVPARGSGEGRGDGTARETPPHRRTHPAPAPAAIHERLSEPHHGRCGARVRPPRRGADQVAQGSGCSLGDQEGLLGVSPLSPRPTDLPPPHQDAGVNVRELKEQWMDCRAWMEQHCADDARLAAVQASLAGQGKLHWLGEMVVAFRSWCGGAAAKPSMAAAAAVPSTARGEPGTRAEAFRRWCERVRAFDELQRTTQAAAVRSTTSFVRPWCSVPSRQQHRSTERKRNRRPRPPSPKPSVN